MSQSKRGNGKRKPKRARIVARQRKEHLTSVQAVEIPRLSLYRTDPITGNEDTLSSLFYEYYRGYTIYSTETGRCCIHGKDGCLRIQGRYVCFPDVEQAKLMIKYFQTEGRTSRESMNRFVPEDAYRCLNTQRRSYERRQPASLAV
jgi:hypothetical protein